MVFVQFIVIPQPPEEKPDDLVGPAYVARRFGCSIRGVQAGACGTDKIIWVTRKPLRATRAHVEEVHAKHISVVQSRDIAAAVGSKRRTSLVRRGKRPLKRA